ncbi:nitric oxide synthase oxygenase [Micromonospora chokoriensis]
MAFLRQLYAENGQNGPQNRIQQVAEEIAETGSWWPTTEELTSGARMAWRNAARCIGRARWNTLVVRDLRHISQPAAIADELRRHLDLSTNGGAIRSVISVFAPSAPQLLNPQLVRYAGWSDAQGTVTGDPDQVDITAYALRHGWAGPTRRTPFDVLPWLIRDASRNLSVFPVPPESVLEVRLSHPQHDWFSALELRWPALPAISNMTLTIGGCAYPCAPFSGFYMASEIAARNLADHHRYDMLPRVATKLGLDIRRDDLWRDKTLIVLQEAVLHSFRSAGVSITDHHRESRSFATFTAREEAAGRAVAGDWTWLNSYPMTPQDPSWGRYYVETGPSDPAFHPRSADRCPS